MHSTDTTARIQHAWRRELPDAPTDALGITRRIELCAGLLAESRRRILATQCVDPTVLDLLSVLRRSGPPYRLEPSELTERSQVSAGAITRRMARAEAAGFVAVRRTRSGTRTAAVMLTAAGHRCVDEALTGLLAAQNELLGDLSAGQRTELTDSLAVLLASLRDRLGVLELPGPDC